MAKELKRIDVSKVPELLRIAQEVQATRRPYVLGQDSEDLAMVTPVGPVAKRSTRGLPVTEDDALFRLIGIGHSGITEGVARNKHKYLADAYRHR